MGNGTGETISIISQLEKTSPIEERVKAAGKFLLKLVSEEGQNIRVRNDSDIVGGRVLGIELPKLFCLIKLTERNRVLPGHSEMLSLEEIRGLYMAVFPGDTRPVDLYGTHDSVIGLNGDQTKVKPRAGFSIDQSTFNLRGYIHQLTPKGKVWLTAAAKIPNSDMDTGNRLLVKTTKAIAATLGVVTN